MNSFDAAMLALAVSLLAKRDRRMPWTAGAPWIALTSGLLLPAGWSALAAAMAVALWLGEGAAAGLLLCIPDYSGVGEAALTAALWLGGLLLLQPALERYDASRLPLPLAGAPIRLMVAGGFALAASPLSYL